MEEKLITTNISSKKIIEIPLELISSKDVNPRKSGLIIDNVDKLVASEEFPEIHLGLIGEELIIVDGYHRFAATQRLGRDKINAFVTKFDNLDDLKKQAFISNVNHGIMLSELDIALNIYEFYLIETAKKPIVKLSEIIADYGIPERRGRSLFYWTVFNREILKNNSTDLSSLTKYEDYNKILKHRNEKIGEISDLFKDEFMTFYHKYDHLPILEKRQAIGYYIDGKDYYEELEREAEERRKAEEEAKANEFDDIGVIPDSNDHYSPDYIGDDECDRNANVSYEAGSSNETIQKLTESAEDIKEKLETATKEKTKKLESVTNLIKKNAENLMTIRLLQTKGKVEITKQDYNELQAIMDVISEIIADVNVKEMQQMI